MQINIIQDFILEWEKELMLTLCDNNSFGIAVFTEGGELLCANEAMLSLCIDFSSSSLLNPTFERLRSLNTTDSLLFSGFLTIGKYNNVNTTIEARVYRKADRLLLTGGINVSDLIEQNKTMHILNQKVSNLQRQLTQEKAELEHTMKELKETQQMLIHSEKMNAMGKLVAGVAHELNNPIAFVYSNLFSLEKYMNEVFKSYVEVEELVSKKASPELNSAVTGIREKNDMNYLSEDINDIVKESKIGIMRVKAIVEDLRRFSRLDESEIKQIDLIENIKSTVSIANSELTRKNINFAISAPDHLWVNCYPGQLNQAILNVLINSIYAVRVGGLIILSVTEDEKNIHISVNDNGCGIPEEIRERIFDPFFTTKPVGSGTGLGLSITYKIIHDLHHGSIEVESEPEKETIIKLSIPKNIIG
jgi:two-component system, NtrC family, sensor kinase